MDGVKETCSAQTKEACPPRVRLLYTDAVLLVRWSDEVRTHAAARIPTHTKKKKKLFGTLVCYDGNVIPATSLPLLAMHEATLKRVRALFRLQADEGCRNPISLQAAGKSLKLTAVDWELEYQANDWFSFPLFLK
ncbi:hypothetical protein OUZ56_008733 [Daphnia magna]|uniref:Uncharacterized protein n=1 Tax=Daphnia magna TaxID=35525 RepID=A0ABR0ADW0_9CRUS|nr:hypothetical protein OUZ56_008733 [Daphnia magna]